MIPVPVKLSPEDAVLLQDILDERRRVVESDPLFIELLGDSINMTWCNRGDNRLGWQQQHSNISVDMTRNGKYNSRRDAAYHEPRRTNNSDANQAISLHVCVRIGEGILSEKTLRNLGRPWKATLESYDILKDNEKAIEIYRGLRKNWKGNLPQLATSAVEIAQYTHQPTPNIKLPKAEIQVNAPSR
jgi:hypothetical protein